MKTIEFDVPEYSWFNDGKGIDESIVDIITKYNVLKRDNERLREQNKQLKSENYKDEELQRLNNENKKLHDDLIRGFRISEKEHNSIIKWQNEHNCKYANTGFKGISCYRFSIIPGIGYNGYVKCTCGEEFCFYEE